LCPKCWGDEPTILKGNIGVSHRQTLVRHLTFSPWDILYISRVTRTINLGLLYALMILGNIFNGNGALKEQCLFVFSYLLTKYMFLFFFFGRGNIEYVTIQPNRYHRFDNYFRKLANRIRAFGCTLTLALFNRRFITGRSFYY